MKNACRSLVAAVCALLFVTLSGSAVNLSKADSLNIVNKIKAIVPGSLKPLGDNFHALAVDYDFDGRCELVAFVTDEDMMTTYMYKGGRSKASLYKKFDGVLYDVSPKASLSDCSVICFTVGWGGPGSEGYMVLFTPAGARCESVGESVSYKGKRDFAVTYSDYNASYSKADGSAIGHCWYDIPHYLDSSLKLRKYGSHAITETSFRKYGNTAPLFRALNKENAKILGIILRDDGTINVNARRTKANGYENYYATGRLKNGNISWTSGDPTTGDLLEAGTIAP